MVLSTVFDCGAKDPRFKPVFDQNPGTNASCQRDRIRMSTEACDIKVACVSVISLMLSTKKDRNRGWWDNSDQIPKSDQRQIRTEDNFDPKFFNYL